MVDVDAYGDSTTGAFGCDCSNRRKREADAEDLEDFRRRTLSWWRSTKISASSEARDRKNPISPHQISLQRAKKGAVKERPKLRRKSAAGDGAG